MDDTEGFKDADGVLEEVVARDRHFVETRRGGSEADPDAPAGHAVLRFDRSFSAGALARAVIRFQGSGVRPFDPARDGAPARLWAILEEDDPAAGSYPLVEAMTAMLLDGYDGPADAASLSRRLQDLGYDALG